MVPAVHHPYCCPVSPFGRQVGGTWGDVGGQVPVPPADEFTSGDIAGDISTGTGTAERGLESIPPNEHG